MAFSLMDSSFRRRRCPTVVARTGRGRVALESEGGTSLHVINLAADCIVLGFATALCWWVREQSHVYVEERRGRYLGFQHGGSRAANSVVTVGVHVPAASKIGAFCRNVPAIF